MCRGSSSIFIDAFLDLPQHVSASHCHHQGVVVSSEAIWITARPEWSIVEGCNRSWTVDSVPAEQSPQDPNLLHTSTDVLVPSFSSTLMYYQFH
jgi:hypothetical protein